MTLYMLDTDTCSYIMRRYSETIVERFESVLQNKGKIVISAITYSEMRYGAIGSKKPDKVEYIIEEFVKRIDEVLPWTREAIEKSVEIRKQLSAKGIIIGKNDSSIAGHALAYPLTGCLPHVCILRRYPRSTRDPGQGFGSGLAGPRA